MAQLGIAARPMYADGTSCIIMVCSLTNTAATLTPSGGSATSISWNTIGTDRGAGPTQAGYVDHVTVSGLTAFTKYTFTVTQGANSVSGSFYTLPTDSDDFSFFIITCDNNVPALNGQAKGGYDQIASYIQNGSLPTVGIVHIDDLHGYPDLAQVDDSAGTGHASTGQASTTTKQYDYAINYFNAYGLLQDATDQEILWGHDVDRQYCMANANLWPQWGDHEFEDDLGWNVDNTIPTATYVSGKAAWDAFMLPGQPTAIDGSNSNAWGFALGGVKLVAPDGITNGNAGISPNKVVYGNTQIDSVKTALSTSEPFKVLILEHGIRYLDATEAEFTSGTQHPLFNDALPEYKRLFTDATTGLMQNVKTNGVNGSLLTVHGDYHRGLVLKNEADAYSGQDKEWFYSLHVATINGSLNFAVDGGAGGTTIKEGLVFAGSTVEYLQESGTFGTPATDWHVTRFDYYGSRFPKELEVTMTKGDETVVWNKKFVYPRGGNDAHAITADLSLKSNSGADE